MDFLSQNKPTSLTTSQPFDPESLAKKILNELDVSEQTRIDYNYRIPLFIKFITDHGINEALYLDYKREMAKHNEYAIATKNKYLAVARVFLKELNRRGILPLDLTANIKTFPAIKKHKKDGLTFNEVVKIAKRLKRMTPSKKTYRLRALYCLLALQGLRSIEVIRLDVADIDLAAQTAKIQGKGQLDKQTIHLHPDTVKTLRQYIKENKVKDGALFPGLGNRTSNRITTMTIKRDVREMLAGVGITELGKGAHAFRHFYITTLLEKFNPRDVRKFSRHKSLEMLIVYDDELDIAKKAKETFSAFSGITPIT